MTLSTLKPLLTFDHIGIVVADVDAAAIELQATLRACEQTERFDDEVLGVIVRFVRDASGVVYEMIAPLGPESPVARTLKSGANLLNQIAYRTGDFAAAADHLRDRGAFPVGPAKPAKAFGGAKVQFFLCEFGFLIELIDREELAHSFSPFPQPA